MNALIGGYRYSKAPGSAYLYVGQKPVVLRAAAFFILGADNGTSLHICAHISHSGLHYHRSRYDTMTSWKKESVYPVV